MGSRHSFFKRDYGHDLGGLYLQRPGQLLDCLKLDGPVPSLDEADVGPVKASGIGKGFLRHAPCRPQLADLLPKLDDEPGAGHRGQASAVQTLVPQTRRNIYAMVAPWPRPSPVGIAAGS